MRDAARGTALLTIALAVAGCGGVKDGIEREPVSGKITLDGKPLDDAQITFAPEQGDDPSAGAGAAIKVGTYSLSRGEGPAVGSHRVSIWARRPTGKKIPSDDQPGTSFDETRETLPDRYNARSSLKADIKKGGPNQFDFDLTSKKQ
jgi:hypothetical protein